MKPFKINRSSWHYKFNTNFMPTDGNLNWEFNHSNFCAYWRATVLRMIVASVFTFSAGMFLFVLGALIYSFPLGSLKVFAFIVGVAIIAMATNIILKERKNKAKNISKTESLFLQKYRAHKEKICPVVVFEN